MKLTQRICAIFMIAALTPLCHAAINSDKDHTLKITLHNDSKQTLMFTHVTNENSSSAFFIDNKKILPGNTAIITATTTSEEDLAGIMHFSDDTDDDNLFVILDQLKFHQGQPFFNFTGDKLSSSIQSKTQGNGGARALHYVAATVEVTDKNGS